jgi:hypothetical protein
VLRVIPGRMVVAFAVWIAIMSGVIFFGGVVTGAWRGPAFGIVGVVAMVDWLRLRATGESAAAVADRLVNYIALLMLGLCYPAVLAIEAWAAR